MAGLANLADRGAEMVMAGRTHGQHAVPITLGLKVAGWIDEIGQRPAVKKAMAAGPEYREDPATITPEEQARRSQLLTHQRAQALPKEWT